MPYAVRMHAALTGYFVGSATRRVRHGPEPPPPSTGVFRAFLRMHRPLTSMFGRRLLCLWGQFVGTYSALAYAACAGWRGRERPVRCGFAAEAGSGGAVHRHALCMPMQLP